MALLIPNVKSYQFEEKCIIVHHRTTKSCSFLHVGLLHPSIKLHSLDHAPPRMTSFVIEYLWNKHASADCSAISATDHL